MDTIKFSDLLNLYDLKGLMKVALIGDSFDFESTGNIKHNSDDRKGGRGKIIRNDKLKAKIEKVLSKNNAHLRPGGFRIFNGNECIIEFGLNYDAYGNIIKIHCYLDYDNELFFDIKSVKSVENYVSHKIYKLLAEIGDAIEHDENDV